MWKKSRNKLDGFAEINNPQQAVVEANKHNEREMRNVTVRFCKLRFINLNN